MPTPNILLKQAQEEAEKRKQDSFETMKKAVAEDFATYGIPFDPDMYGVENQISKKELEELYGREREYDESAEVSDIPGCIYSQGESNPDICYDPNGKVVYNANKDPIIKYKAYVKKLMNARAKKAERRQNEVAAQE